MLAFSSRDTTPHGAHRKSAKIQALTPHAALGFTAGMRNQVWFLGNGSNPVYRTLFPNF